MQKCEFAICAHELFLYLQNTEIKRPCRGQSSGSSEGVKEQHEQPEVLDEGLSSGTSGAADKEGKSDVTRNLYNCSVFGSVFSNITDVSPDAQKEDKDEDNIDTTSSSKTADEEVNKQRRHKTIQFTERRPAVVHMWCNFVTGLMLNLLI